MKSKYNIIWHNELDSTNSEAARHLTGLDNLSVLSALSQTSGRGQGTHTWTSRPGENLTFSIVLKPENICSKDSFTVSQITALSVVRFLNSFGIEAQIKWPNDIYVLGKSEGKKICGILIENIFKGDYLASSIIGIGLNINQTDFPEDLPNPISLRQLTGKEHNLEDCLETFLDIFTDIYNNRNRYEISSCYDKLMFRL